MTPRALALILVLATPLARCAADSTSALPNGLQVITVTSPGSDVCGLHIALRIGPERVPAAKAGLRALTQQVLLQRMREQISARPELAALRQGPSDDSGLRVETQWDTVEFTATTTAGDLPAVLGFLSSSILEATWENDDVVAAREAMAEDDDAPGGRIASTVVALFLAALTGSPAQGQPMFGTPESRGAITLADVRAYYRAYYVPNLTSVCLVSPLPDAEAQAVVRKAFGAFEARENVSALPPVARLSESRVQIGASPAIEDALCMVGVPLPPVSSPDFAVARVIHAALSGPGGSLSRLRLPNQPARNLRDTAAHEPILDVVPLPLSRYPYLALFARVRPSAVEAARTIMLGALLDLTRQPLSDEDLARARTRALNLELLSLEKPAATAARVNQGAVMGEVETPGPKLGARIQQVSAQDVQEFANTYFTRHAVGVLMPGD